MSNLGGDEMILTNELKGRFVAKGYTQVQVAEKIGISPKALGIKLKRGVLKSNEIEALMELLEIEDPRPIFFAKKVT